MINGFLNVMKPRGMSSHAVVAVIRRLAGQKQVGHAGTLDPDATGVLPLALGQYTRLIEFAVLTPKVYRATVALGTLTTTGDHIGVPVGRSGAPWPSLQNIEQARAWLEGRRWQVPPQVSALKVEGQRHYQAVREGLSVWPKPRRMTVERITVVEASGRSFQFEATVGSGTYVRAMARDWGFLLGHAAHLSALCRTQVGTFHAHTAWTLTRLGEMGSNWVDAVEGFQDHLACPTVEISRGQAEAVRQGKWGVWPSIPDVYTPRCGLTYQGTLVAVMEGPPWHYRKVLALG